MRRPPDSERLYEFVGRTIRQIRAEARLSQTALAKRCGLTRGSIANIELGNQRPTLHTLWTVAEALNVEPRDLVPARDELRAPPASQSEATGKRVSQVVGKSSDKVASFIATSRQEVLRDGSAGDGAKSKAPHNARGT